VLQSKYEAKKRRLKAIRKEWSSRLSQLRNPSFVGPRPLPTTRLSYGELVGYYIEARDRLVRFIRNSNAHHQH
jgi:hypothetical protein